MLLLSGCVQTVYEVELTPQGDSIDRSLTVWVEDSSEPPQNTSPSEEIVKRLDTVYADHEHQKDGNKVVYRGSFVGEMPQDIGGSGEYQRYESPFGELFVYRERFGADVDLVTPLKQRQAGIDRFVDLIADWMASEIDDPQMNQRVDELLRFEVRNDLQNLGLYLWTFQATSRLETTENGDDLMAYVANYLIEREYITLEDLPSLARLMVVGDASKMADAALRLFATKLGVEPSAPIPESLHFLKDRSAAKASLDAYLRTTEIYRQKLAEWKKNVAMDSAEADQKEPNPFDVLSESIMVDDYLNAYAPDDWVRVLLHCGSEPIETNGKWDDQNKTVKWEDSIVQPPLPMLVYAVWVEPNDDNQKNAFGGIKLGGAELRTYVVCYQAMTPEERSKWDGLMERLKSETKAALFQTEFDATFADPAALPSRLCEMVLDVLNSKT
ncbi:hypothetical protein Q31b_27550 [Novipirellula aureliae]|uniref:Uncharacterized protein n=1 Tax=Novipirellula aureliae TaxID=2527966 RepID=A0A5C6E1R5_9BACT|nr:hypothetical protein [Novipirellula aureliae]TWU41316.1 hypothetical protein Q31b_27550 [Novipirellula aureliae]